MIVGGGQLGASKNWSDKVLTATAQLISVLCLGDAEVTVRWIGSINLKLTLFNETMLTSIIRAKLDKFATLKLTLKEFQRNAKRISKKCLMTGSCHKRRCYHHIHFFWILKLCHKTSANSGDRASHGAARVTPGHPSD